MEEVTLIPQAEDATARTVLVTNISPQATNKTVADFFAFCGTISSLTMRTNTESSEKVQEAIIEFSQEAATKTALLLTNALIIDRPINVSRFTGQLPNSSENEKVRVYKESEIENKPHELPANERSQTSVVASLIAAGYQLASGTLETAKSYDEKYAVTEQIKGSVDSVVNAVKSTSAALDNQYKISETTSAWYKAASDKVTEMDRRYGVTDSATAVAASAEKVVNDLSQNPTVVATSQVIKNTGTAVASYTDQLGKDVQKIIDEQPTLKAASDAVTATVSSVSGVVEETGRLIRNQDPATKEGVEGSSGTSSSSTTTTTTTVETHTAPTSTTTSSTTSSSSSAPEVNPSSGIGTEPPLEKRD